MCEQDAKHGRQAPSEPTLTETDCKSLAASAPEVTAPHLFVALECDRPAAGVTRHSLANIDRVLLARGAERDSDRSFEGSKRTLTIRLPDPHMSSRHASLERKGAHFVPVDLDSRNGTRVNGAPLRATTPLADCDLIQVGHTLLLFRSATPVSLLEPADVDSAKSDAAHLLATIHASLAGRLAALGRVARSASPVLLLGETGAGKEVLARNIHRLSKRAGPFVAINCGALPATLIEAQLFGHVRGAFSGAIGDAPGLLRSADGGTVLLDEVGDLPPSAQAALLRALQEHEVLPVGAARPVKVDFRVLAATHRPMEKLVANGDFREDLFARLAGFTFRLPPLRDRPEDIGLLVSTFVSSQPIRFTPAAGRTLLAYEWPLNIRELVQAMEVAVVLAGAGKIDVSHLPAPIADAVMHHANGAPQVLCDEPLREKLIESLVRHQGNVSAVARDFDKARIQVRRWMRRFGVDAQSLRRR